MFNFFKRKKSRGLHELFSSGKIFKAKEKELDDILKKISNDKSKEKIGYREIVRTIITIYIKSSREQKNIQRRLKLLNILLSGIIIALSIITLRLTLQQTNYAEIQSRPDRIREANTRARDIEYCKQNPDSQSPNLFYIKTGEPAPCYEVLKLK